MNSATLELPLPVEQPDAPPTANLPACTLRSLFAAYRWRILLTYGLFNLENLLRLAQPFVLGLAIHDLLQSSTMGLWLLFGQHVTHLLLSAGRRRYDTRTFTAIYADLATRLVLDQRGRRVEISRVAARSALAREIVDFYERHVPFIFHALYSVLGALAMLLFCDWLIVPFCLILLGPVAVLSVVGGRKTYTLNQHLNDELEREVEVITRARPLEVRSHYRLVAQWRVRLANWDALTFCLVDVCILGLMATALVRCCSLPDIDAGRIMTILGYVLMFVDGLVSVPLLIQQCSRLRDIGRRVQSDGEPAQAPTGDGPAAAFSEAGSAHTMTSAPWYGFAVPSEKCS
jgi:hypothetical protein